MVEDRLCERAVCDTAVCDRAVRDRAVCETGLCERDGCESYVVRQNSVCVSVCVKTVKELHAKKVRVCV